MGAFSLIILQPPDYMMGRTDVIAPPDGRGNARVLRGPEGKG